MIDVAKQIEDVIVNRINDKVAGIAVSSNPEALTADDYDLKTADGFVLVTYLMSTKFEPYRNNSLKVTMQFLIAFGYKRLEGNEGLRSRMKEVYYALRGLQVKPMVSALMPIALRPVGKNEAEIWRGDIIVETTVYDNINQGNATES
jgi:hypothetical protein